MPESARGRKCDFFALCKRSSPPMFVLASKAESDARLAGQGFASRRSKWAIVLLDDAWRCETEAASSIPVDPIR